MAGTTWPSLTAGQPARAADVESKFDWLEGPLVPMSNGSSTDAVHDLGSTTARWRDLHLSRRLAIGTSPVAALTIQGNTDVTSALIYSGTTTAHAALGMGRTASEARFIIPANAGDYVTGSQVGDLVMRMDTTTTRVLFTNNGTAVNLAVGSTGVAVGTTTANVGALLELAGTRAMLLSRLTTAQRDALTGVNGMMIYNSSSNVFQIYQNGGWVPMGGVMGLAETTTSQSGATAGITSTVINAINYSGSGRLRHIRMFTTADWTAGASMISSVTVDGVALTGFTVSTSGTHWFANNPTGSTAPFTTTTNPTHPIQMLDIYFRTSLRVQFAVVPNSNNTHTASIIVSTENAG